jgi:Na+/H+-dicarboxylate symporter
MSPYYLVKLYHTYLFFQQSLIVKISRDLANKIAGTAEQITSILLKIISYLIPMFVVGFIVKLQYDGVIAIIVKDYTLIFAIVLFAQFIYIILIYFIAANFRVSEFVASIKHMLPAAIAGFSTMSSAASMPLTIIGVESNAKNKDLARCLGNGAFAKIIDRIQYQDN